MRRIANPPGALILAFCSAWVAAAPAANDGVTWPGLPPDCWTEARIFHGGEEGSLWEKNTRITQVVGEPPKPGEFSPNRGYYFVRSGDWPKAQIDIYAEKAPSTRIEFVNTGGLGSVTWISEKLLAIRVWWGRATGNDLIFDVEGNTVIYAEQFFDGAIAFRQFRESCPEAGCTCIGVGRGR